jgi:hypothetical protein
MFMDEYEDGYDKSYYWATPAGSWHNPVCMICGEVINSDMCADPYLWRSRVTEKWGYAHETCANALRI